MATGQAWEGAGHERDVCARARARFVPPPSFLAPPSRGVLGSARAPPTLALSLAPSLPRVHPSWARARGATHPSRRFYSILFVLFYFILLRSTFLPPPAYSFCVLHLRCPLFSFLFCLFFPVASAADGDTREPVQKSQAEQQSAELGKTPRFGAVGVACNPLKKK